MKKNKNIVIYHNKDFDGLISALQFKEYEEVVKNNKFEFIGYDYSNDDEVKEQIEKYIDEYKINKIYFVDCVINDWNYLKQLSDQKNNIYVIDHHKMKFDEFQDFIIKNKYVLPEEQSIIGGKTRPTVKIFNTDKYIILIKSFLKYYFSEKESAASIVYSFLGHYNNNKTDFIKYISDYDTFNFYENNNMNVYYFQLFLKSKMTYDVNKENYKIYKQIIDNFDININKYIQTGKLIYDYLKNKTFNYVLYNKVLYINSIADDALIVYDKFKDLEYDFIVFYYLSNSTFKISFRCDNNKKNIDLRKIAKSFGGGGHKCAAGCNVDYKTFFNKIYMRLNSNE